MEMYYQRRLIHLANNCIDHFISLRLFGLNSSIIPLQAIKRVDSDTFYVQSQDTSIIPLQAIKRADSDTFYVQSQDTQEEVYVVDMHIGGCSCKGGFDGSPSSHQTAVSKHFHISSNSVPTLFSEKRQELANIFRRQSNH